MSEELRDPQLGKRRWYMDYDATKRGCLHSITLRVAQIQCMVIGEEAVGISSPHYFGRPEGKERKPEFQLCGRLLEGMVAILPLLKNDRVERHGETKYFG